MCVNVVGGGSRWRIRSSARGTLPSACRPPAVRLPRPSGPRTPPTLAAVIRWASAMWSPRPFPRPDPAQARPAGGGRAEPAGRRQGAKRVAWRRSGALLKQASPPTRHPPATAVASQGRPNPVGTSSPEPLTPIRPDPARPSATAQRSRDDHLRRLSAPRPTICDGSPNRTRADPIGATSTEPLDG